MRKTPHHSRRLAILCGLLLPLVTTPRLTQAAASGSIISYQGILSGTNGAPVADGAQTLTFKIYDNGTVVFSQTAPVATVNGVFNTFLGVGALSFDPTHPYELGITYNGVEARHPIAAVPLAINATNATNATTAANFTGNLAGDVTGTQGATVVSKLQGTSIAATAPTTGQVLTFNGTSYAPATSPPATVQSDGLTLTGDGSTANKLAIKNGGVSQTQVNNGYVDLSSAQTIAGIKTFNQTIAGSITGSAASFTGNLAGDVTGTQGATVVAGIQGKPVSATAPTTGQVLGYNGTSYVPTTPAASTDGTTITGNGNTTPLKVGTVQQANVNNGYVDLSSAQTVGGAKTFTSPVNTSTQYNIGGNRTLSLTGGTNSVAVGVSAGPNNTGDSNTFVGGAAGLDNSTGNDNTFVGDIAGFTNTTGKFNTFLGSGAGQNNSTGQQNAFVGYLAGGGGSGNNTTGNSNIALGFGAGYNLTTGDNNIDIGNQGNAGEAATIRLGTQGTQTATYIAGISGQGVAALNPVYVDSTGKLGTMISSSRRFKQDIADIGSGSNWLLHLRPVSFRYTAAFLKADKPSDTQYGLIAEEVAKVCPQMVHFDGQGRPDGVMYQNLPIMLLNEVQRQQRTIDDLQARLAKLEGKNGAAGSQPSNVAARLSALATRK
ncbi:MAG: tail fiber domain-containing protein [Abitibacteriaceae bacterium]|nr:tail fiber domain-containing protein [Abditibacteriaceae bacterium]